MDRFSKTTEIDTTEVAAAAVEDDTPQKSKVGIIIALVVCLLIAVVIWLFVMEADIGITQKIFTDVPVYSDYTDVVPVEEKEITVNGVRKNIIDLRASDFKIVLIDGKYEVYLVAGKADFYSLTNESTSNEIIVSVIAK